MEASTPRCPPATIFGRCALRRKFPAGQGTSNHEQTISSTLRAPRRVDLSAAQLFEGSSLPIQGWDRYFSVVSVSVIFVPLENDPSLSNAAARRPLEGGRTLERGGIRM